MAGIVVQRGGAGGFSEGVSNLGNTSGTSGTVASQIVLAGGNNVTLSQSINGQSATITISAANQTVESQSAGISNLGNTSGTSGIASGGQLRLLLAGGNNITLSQSLNGASATVTISAFNQSVQPVGTDTLGISNLGNTSGTSGTISGSAVQFVLAGGNNVTLSQSINGSSATVTISAFNQTVELQTAGISNLGNTSGTSGVASGGQVQFVLAGGNNVTLSQSLNGASATVTISAFNQSVQPVGTDTIGISNLGNTSGTSGVISGSGVQFVLAGGNNVTLSQSINGSSATVTISAFNQTVESQTAGISNLGNTSGTSGVASGAQVRLLLAGGNNITLSQSLNGASATVTISAPNQTVQPIGTNTLGISNLGNTSGTSGVITGTGVQLILAGGNNITLSQSLNGSSATVTISAPNQTVESQTVGISNLGNTSGTSGVASGGQVQLILAGGNNVTLSQSLNGASATVTISAGGAGAGMSAGISNLGNTSGTSGTVTNQLIFAGGNNITLSQSTGAGGNTITISAFNQTVESQTAGISNLGNTSGTSGVVSGAQVRFLLAGGNNITLSQSTNGASATVTISGPNATAGSDTAGISNLGNTSGTSGVVSGDQIRFILAGGNNITLSQSTNGASATVTISAFNQTAATQTFGISNLGNTSGTSGVVNGDDVQFVLAGGNNVTLSQSINGFSATITISAFNQTVESQTMGISNLGNTSGTSGVASGGQLRLILAGGNNITLSQSLNGASATITISAPNLGAGAFSGGISNLGNTAGSSGITGTQLVFVGTGPISLSQSTGANGGTLSINAPAVSSLSALANITIGTTGSTIGFSAQQSAIEGFGVSNTGNTLGDTGISTGVDWVIAGLGNVTVSQSTAAGANTVWISGAGGGGANSINFYQNIGLGQGTGSGGLTGSSTQATSLAIFPFTEPTDQFPGNMTANTIMMQVSGPATSNNSAAFTYTAWLGFYVISASSTLSLVFSASTTWSLSANSNNSISVGGRRWLTWHSSQFNNQPVFSDGVHYWAGAMMNFNGQQQSYSYMGIRANVSQLMSGSFNKASATNTSVQAFPFHGAYSTRTAAMPSSIHKSQINATGSDMAQFIPLVRLDNYGLT